VGSRGKVRNAAALRMSIQTNPSPCTPLICHSRHSNTPAILLLPSYPFIFPSSYHTNSLKPIARRKLIHRLKPHWTPCSANIKTLPSTTSLCPVFLISRLLIGQCHVYLIPVGYPFRMSRLFTLHIIHQSLSAASNQWRSCSQPVCLHQ